MTQFETEHNLFERRLVLEIERIVIIARRREHAATAARVCRSVVSPAIATSRIGLIWCCHVHNTAALWIRFGQLIAITERHITAGARETETDRASRRVDALLLRLWIS